MRAILLDQPPAPPAELELQFRPVPAGEFVMGRDDGRTDERPAHAVSTRAFEAGVVPVTNRRFAAFLAATGHEKPRFWDDPLFNQPDQPVVGVSWYDAVAYCEWLSHCEGRAYRLPTEAEREKLALGGAGTRYPWGDEDPPFAGPLALGSAGQDRPLPVGLSGPNGYGLFDTAYNVHEWCSDWYEAGYYTRSPVFDPRGPDEGRRRASRGGAWRHHVKVNRCAARSSLNPQLRYNDYGFRVAREL